MAVYIESVLLENFIIDYMLIKATLNTVGITADRRRLFLCAFFGAVTALAFPLLSINSIILTAIKILSGLILVLFSSKDVKGKKLYLCFIFFVAYTFILGGSIIAFYSFLGVSYYENLNIPLTIGLSYAFIKLISVLIKYLYRQKEVKAFTAKVVLIKNGTRIKASGFFDTGNGVYYKNSPVIFASKSVVEKFFLDARIFTEIKKIGVSTVNGYSEKPCFNLDALEIYFLGNVNIFNNVTLCVCNDGLGASYDVILSPAFMEGEHAKNNSKTEKAS